MEKQNIVNPTFVPDEYKVPYDIIELPSQGLLYPTKQSSVKVEYLTAYDENILTSPNIINSGKVIDVLLENKIKDLTFDIKDLLEGDRMAILLYLRTSAFGEEYVQPVIDPTTRKVVEGVVNLTEIKFKKLEIKPTKEGYFDFVLPKSQKKVVFRLLTGKDEEEITTTDEELMERTGSEVSTKTTLRLERAIMALDGVNDKIKISNTLKTLSLIDVRALNKYITEIEPGVDFSVIARTPGGGSVSTFLRINKNFFWPEL